MLHRQQRNPCPSAFATRFSQARNKSLEHLRTLTIILTREKPCPATPLRNPATRSCTKSGHPPVDAVHSTENKRDKTAYFSLTLKIEGVQQDRSLTTSRVFPVGAASGAQAKSPSHCANAEGGLVRVYSKALVEENEKPSRRQDRVPRRWVGLSGWR